MKKTYIAPRVRTEKVELGVFGSYGSGGTSSLENAITPFRFIASLFKVMCCD